MGEEDPDLETTFKVVAIMQTITEELDDDGRRAWRKMLGITTPPNTSLKDRGVKKSKQPNSTID